MQVKARVTTSFEGVREWSDEFLSLFPHRFDYIYASYPEPGTTPDWQTESRHPLSDRLIRQGSYLYGVRFASETNYCLLDIDSGSLYHPKRDPFAVSRISAALEELGLVSSVACTSSYSGGLHLYFPFEQPQKSWNLAVAVQTLLENAGFKLTLGQLEVFPNPKLYVTSGKPNLYAAHRLPMQTGSYLLNDKYEIIYSSFELFVQQWQFACQRNDVQSGTVEAILKTSRRKQYCISGKADKFLNDLNADIEPGWTGYGQTNYILGRIAMRSYVFGHLLYGAYPLEGKALVDDIVRVAKALPGYQQWCRHQHEIEKRAEEWARCVENSRYFHFGTRKLKSATSDTQAESHVVTEQRLTWNQRQSDAVRERIKSAIADMLETRSLPNSPTERFRALTRYQIGGGSLYRHRDLWHPSYFFELPAEPDPKSAQLSIDVASEAESTKESDPVENVPIFLFQNDGCEEDCGKPASSSPHLTSLLAENGCNSSVQAAFSHFSMSDPKAAGGNIQSQSPWLESTLTAAQDGIEQRTQHRIQAQQTVHLARLQRYLTSGDPILMAEAIALTQPASHPQLPRPLSSARSVDEREDRSDDWPPLFNQARVLNRATASLGDDDPDDFSNILVAISVQLRRLGWSPHSISDRLYGLFGKRRQMLLTDDEILQWLEYLEQQKISGTT